MPGSSSSHSSLVMLASNLGDNDSDSCSMSLLFAVPWFGNAEFDCNCQDMGNPVPWRNGCRRGGPCRRGGAVGGRHGSIELEKKRADRKLRELDREPDANPLAGLLRGLARD
uniref:Uncharacterized protein n=1 Tax=Oryza nivara TaxID=4536 RepID=A0A0E0GED8_ORYNI